MKTRLLLLFLFTISMVSTAQFSINEGFESGLPAGWANNGYTTGIGGCGSLRAMSMQYSQSTLFGSFTTSNYTSNGNAITFSVSFNVGLVGEPGTVIVETSYAVNNGNFIAISSGTTGPTTSCQRINFTIPAGVVPAGSLIKFGFGGRRQSRTTVLRYDNIIIDQQSSSTVITPTLVANFTFNNTLNSTNGNSPFSATNTSFVADRNNIASSAVQISASNNAVSATIANLPIGSAERTISFWHKKPTTVFVPPPPKPKKISAVQPVGLFSYGTTTSLGSAFGLYLNEGENYVFQQAGSDVVFNNTTTPANVWVHSVLTFKDNIVKLYNNGVLISFANVNLNTGDSSFRLGSNLGNVEFDDLQIFSTALNQSQVADLYTNNTLSSSDFSQSNLKVTLYPNPLKDILNIETANEIKSVEIYNLVGQKVKTAKSRNINVSDLSNGTYLVRIEDENNAVETKRIVKE